MEKKEMAILAPKPNLCGRKELECWWVGPAVEWWRTLQDYNRFSFTSIHAVTNGHRRKLSKLHSNRFSSIRGPPKINPHENHMENSSFPPPLGHGSSESPAVDVNPCPSVTGIASNRQTDTDKFSLSSGGIRK
jgi:hypothetical protein